MGGVWNEKLLSPNLILDKHCSEVILKRNTETFDSIHFSITFQDPALITNVSNYEPYSKIRDVNGYVNWPSDVIAPSDSTDNSGAMLGYVRSESFAA